jgi:uncharacterized membrane protein
MLALSSIDTIVRLEQEDELKVSRVERIADSIGGFIGTLKFVGIQLILVGIWVTINAGEVRIVPIFDPYPFFLLAGLLCLECVTLTSLVLIRQNKMSVRADRRNHLMLQINLLAEKESTKIIQMLERLGRHVGLEEEITDRETRELSKETAVEGIAEELRRHIE